MNTRTTLRRAADVVADTVGACDSPGILRVHTTDHTASFAFGPRLDNEPDPRIRAALMDTITGIADMLTGERGWIIMQTMDTDGVTVHVWEAENGTIKPTNNPDIICTQLGIPGNTAPGWNIRT